MFESILRDSLPKVTIFEVNELFKSIFLIRIVGRGRTGHYSPYKLTAAAKSIIFDPFFF